MMRKEKVENLNPKFRQASLKHIRRMCLILILVSVMLLEHIIMIRASSVEHAGEGEMQPELSLCDEIVSMQELYRGNVTDITEDLYMRGLFTKSNPELECVTNREYLSYIYRVKNHVDLDIHEYNTEDIKYKVSIPKGIHSLRILDSSTEQDEIARKQQNRVFTKLLYSFRMFEFLSLVIEGIKIGPEEQVLLALQGDRRSTLRTDRLIFRNVTAKTIRVLFKRFGSVSIKRLCIEECVGIRLNDMVKLRTKYEVDGLELTDVTNLHDYQEFVRSISDLKHLKIQRVLFTSTPTSTDQQFIQLVSSFLSKLKGTLEIDWSGYIQMQKENSWPKCANQISHLHLMDIDQAENMEEELGDTPSAFSSLNTLSLSAKHSKLLDASLLCSIIDYAKKHHRGVKNVVILGKMNIEEVKKAIRDNGSELAQALQEHADTHFTFADNTEIDPSRKYLLFIPLSLYSSKASNMELRGRIGVLGEMSNWDWDKQRGARVLCKTCNTRQEGYVTQLTDGKIICDYCIIENILGPTTNTEAYKNVQLKSTKYPWYPRRVIFLSPELDGQVYLGETKDIYELMKVKYEAIYTKRPAELIHTTQNSTVSTSIANTDAIEQQQEPQQGNNGHIREYTSEYTYEPTTQPPATKRPRHESAISNRVIIEQSVMPEAQNEDVFGQIVISEEEELQIDIDTLQMHIDAEVTENPNGPRPQNWMTELLEEALRLESMAQEVEQPESMIIFEGPPVLTNEDLERYLSMDTADPEEELVYTQL